MFDKPEKELMQNIWLPQLVHIAERVVPQGIMYRMDIAFLQAIVLLVLYEPLITVLISGFPDSRTILMAHINFGNLAHRASTIANTCDNDMLLVIC